MRSIYNFIFGNFLLPLWFNENPTFNVLPRKKTRRMKKERLLWCFFLSSGEYLNKILKIIFYKLTWDPLTERRFCWGFWKLSKRIFIKINDSTCNNLSFGLYSTKNGKKHWTKLQKYHQNIKLMCFLKISRGSNNIQCTKPKNMLKFSYQKEILEL